MLGRMQKLTPTIWFDHTADEAAQFYVATFNAAGLPAEITGRLTYPDPMDFYLPEFAGATRVKFISIDGFNLGLINAGSEHAPTPNYNVTINQPADVLQVLWEALAEGGEALMPLQEYPFSPCYGWLIDRFGFSWQFNANAQLPSLVPSLHFPGTAAHAMDHYVDVFTRLGLGARSGERFPIPEGTPGYESLQSHDAADPQPELVSFATVELAGQPFIMMDSPMPTTFTGGVSTHVACTSDEEEAALRQELSAVPEKDGHGWLEDAFGVTWQLTPESAADAIEG